METVQNLIKFSFCTLFTNIHYLWEEQLEKINDSLNHKAMKIGEELHKCYNPILRVVNFWVEVGVAKNEEKKKAVKNKLTSYILLFSITVPVFIQLVYKSNFGTWILLFGPFGQLKVKVRQSWKQIMLSSILPKTNFPYIELSRRSFFGRIEDTINCFEPLTDL